MKKKKKERNVAIISPVHLYKTRISHKRRDGGRTPVRNRRNTRYIYIKSPLNPLCFGNTCRKSQPPNANIILIAIEKYRHYEETLFSFSPSFLPLSLSFNFAAAQQRPPSSRLTPGTGEGDRRDHLSKSNPPLKKTTPPRDRPQKSHRNDDSVETKRCE